MFEKIKQKAKDVKKWAEEHKTEIAYVAGGVIGVTSTTLAYMYLDEKQHKDTLKKYPHTFKILSMSKYADDMFGYTGNDPNVTVGNLSEGLIAHDASKDDVVVGALVYTKKNTL